VPQFTKGHKSIVPSSRSLCFVILIIIIEIYLPQSHRNFPLTIVGQTENYRH